MPERVHGGFNLLALAYPAFIVLVALAPVLFGRFGSASEPGDSGSSDGPGGGRPPGPSSPPPRPTPLPDADQSHVRLRGPGTLRDRHRRHRRPAHHPVRRPVRTP